MREKNQTKVRTGCRNKERGTKCKDIISSPKLGRKWQVLHFRKTSPFMLLQATSKETVSPHEELRLVLYLSNEMHNSTFKRLKYLNVQSFTVGHKFIIIMCLFHWRDAAPCWDSAG